MKRVAAVWLLLFPAVGTTRAHDTWVLPAQFRLQPGEVLRLGLTSAMDFPKPESPVAADRLVEAKVRLGGATIPLESAAEPKQLVLHARLAGAGVAVAWVATRERSLRLTPEQVTHYLEEVGALDTVGREWSAGGRKPWRETYVKRAKSYVRVGEADDDSWQRPVGLDLELVPESDPTRLSVDDTLALRLLWQGQALPGLAVGAVGASPATPTLATTDAEGRVRFRLTRAGPWLFRATRIVPSQARPGEWDSAFTTLTLEARSR
jgi:uncharacterized GH25 family protein